ncbi:hypothetical protein ACNSPG_22370 (plasmid) [Brucella pituitosa]|uniref:hypothetical protein n=1 Tax=Brucella pituitosa TaxID=571256 RepID=UPI003C7715FB
MKLTMTKIIKSEFADECVLISKTLLLAITAIVSLAAGIMWAQWLLQIIFSAHVAGWFVITASLFSIAAVSMIDEIRAETLAEISVRTLTSALVLSTLLIIIFVSPEM